PRGRTGESDYVITSCNSVAGASGPASTGRYGRPSDDGSAEIRTRVRPSWTHNPSKPLRSQAASAATTPTNVSKAQASPLGRYLGPAALLLRHASQRTRYRRRAPPSGRACLLCAAPQEDLGRPSLPKIRSGRVVQGDRRLGA